MNRREFLHRTAAVGVAVAGGSMLAACSAAGPSSTPASGAATQATSAPAAASGSAAASGVTDTSITFGMMTPLTGPSASLGTDGKAGADVFIQYINDKGGSAGRKWSLVAQDDEFDPQKSITAARYLLDEKKVFGLWGMVGSQVLSSLPLVDQTGVPFMFPYALAHELIQPVRPSLYIMVPTADIQERALSDYLADNLQGDHVFGILALNSPDGMDATSGFKAGKAGKWVKAEQLYERGSTTWQPQLTSLKSAGVTDLVLHASDAWAATILKESQTLGLKASFYGSTGVVSPTIFRLAGNDLVENMTAISISAAPTDDSVAGVKEFLDAFKKYQPDAQPGTFALHSWYTGKLIAAGLDKAGKDLNRASFLKAMDSLQNVDTGNITAPVSFSPGNHLGSSKIILVKAKGGRWTPATDWLAPAA